MVKTDSKILPNSVLIAIALKFSKPIKAPFCTPLMIEKNNNTAPTLTGSTILAW